MKKILGLSEKGKEGLDGSKTGESIPQQRTKKRSTWCDPWLGSAGKRNGSYDEAVVGKALLGNCCGDFDEARVGKGGGKKTGNRGRAAEDAPGECGVCLVGRGEARG